VNAKYIEDQFVNIVKSHGSNQTIMDSTMKIVPKVVEELNPPQNEKRDTKEVVIQHTKARLGQSLKNPG
jgi:hypothetical protein